MPTTMLTQHFTLDEMIASQTAARMGINNYPPPAVIEELRKTCQMLELVRALTGKPILISSGYRSPEVNKAVGGSATSQHVTGKAADFTCPGFGTPHDICRAIINDGTIPYDQLIWEYDSWVHISQNGAASRYMALTINQNGTTSGIA